MSTGLVALSGVVRKLDPVKQRHDETFETCKDVYRIHPPRPWVHSTLVDCEVLPSQYSEPGKPNLVPKATTSSAKLLNCLTTEFEYLNPSTHRIMAVSL
mmetsp:Transcript_1063/g.2259  ORF Transcript_1063/g.2259 Transcript_1063/m.2259 type:complete len:99 (+) Transcript_1063:132-428(+)